MRFWLVILFSLALVLPLSAQKQTTAKGSASATRTTSTKKPAASAAKKKTTTQKKPAAKKTAATKKVDRKTQLRNEQAAAAKARKQSQARLAELNRNVKASLDSMMVLDYKIGKHQTSIDSLNSDIVRLEESIAMLNTELGKLQDELEVKRDRYSKALVRMRRTRSVQSKLMFVLSASNFSQIVRRVRYLQEYSTFQKAQGELLKEKQAEVRLKQNELLDAKAQKETKLHQVEETKLSLQGLKANCQTQMEFLNKNIATVQKQIKQYQEKEAALNAEIERIIQAELEAERRRKAEEARRAEAARKKAEAEAREKARKLAEAKAAAERARKAEAEAKAAQKAAKTEAEKTAAKEAEKRAAKEAEVAEAEVKVAAKEEEETRTKIEAWKSSDANADARLSGSFTSNKGKLPMPITGNYTISAHYGITNVPGLKGVTRNNRGIDIRGQQGCQARAVFDGTVSAIFNYGGTYVVMIRHGAYISVYSGLSGVSVSKGQKVSTRQQLGTIARNSDDKYVLQFQLRKESNSLNPEAWVR